MKFHKYQALGNDFIIVDPSYTKSEITSSQIKSLCDRKFGIGADGLMLVGESRVADVKMIYFNSDGSKAEMCGNGIRCFAKFLVDTGKIQDHFLMIETDAGIKNIEITNDGEFLARVAMGIPRFDLSSLPAKNGALENVKNLLDKEGFNYSHIGLVSVGNPHCVIVSSSSSLRGRSPKQSLANSDIEKIGSKIELMDCFPNKINVEFANPISMKEANVKVWERGVGETLACGTGACAVASFLINNKLADNNIAIKLPGGTLNVYWDLQHDIFLSGTAKKVFEGSI